MAQNLSKPGQPERKRSTLGDPPEWDWLELDGEPISQPEDFHRNMNVFEGQYSQALGNHLIEFLQKPGVVFSRNIVSDSSRIMEFSSSALEMVYFLGGKLYGKNEENRLHKSVIDRYDEIIRKWWDRLKEKVAFFHHTSDLLIDECKTDKSIILSDSDCWALIDEFAEKYPGSPVSEFAKTVFSYAQKTDLNASPLIDEHRKNAKSSGETAEPPPLWDGRSTDLTPVEFVRKHYGIWQDGKWQANGLTKQDLRNDMKLYQALASYERRHPDDALNLPTKKQVNDLWVDRVMSGDETPGTPLEMERFATAARRRGVTLGKSSA